MSAALIAHILDLMSGWPGSAARRMFGGYGIFRQGVMFALVAYDTLYFRTDGRNRPDFEEAGTRPFTYEGKAKPVVMPYWEAPPELFDDPEEMICWGRKAFDAAMAARSKKPKAAGKTPAAKKATVRRKMDRKKPRA